MTAITWDPPEDRRFEDGTDRGVLYLSDGRGVAWNGLVSVDETSGDTSNPFYIDGLKYLDIPSIDDYAGKLAAITYPDEFLEYDGVVALEGGIFIDNQPSKRFGLSYRTMIADKGYKIHLVYNLMAKIDAKNYVTHTNTIVPEAFSWELAAVPEPVDGYRPTAHIIIDSTEINHFLLLELEAILYGNEENEPRLPSLLELQAFLADWTLFDVTDNGDGTWTIDGPDELITWVSPTEFRIEQINATYLDSVTYSIPTT